MVIPLLIAITFSSLQVKLSVCFNWAPRHEGILGMEVAPHILWSWH